MPIANIEQPAIMQIDGALRLRKFDDSFDFAFSWYQDEELVYLVDGVRRPYSYETLSNMYHWLDRHGELYFIEVLDGEWKPVGDVCFWQEDLPIVIGDPAYRGRGIGRKVIRALAERGRQLKYDRICVSEIYAYNTASRKCFESVGFRVLEKTEKGNRYYMKL